MRRSVRCSSSTCLRMVRSRVSFEKPRRSPFSSRSAVMTTFAQKREPSFAHAITLRPQSGPVMRATRSSCSGQWRAMASAG
jgi:hypothetical protein